MTQILTPFFRLTSPGRPSYPPWHSRWSRSTMDRSSSSFPFRGIVLTFKEYIIDAMPLLCQKNNLSTKKSEPESVGFADFEISTVCFSCAFLFKFIPRLSLLCLHLSLTGNLIETIPNFGTKTIVTASCTFKQKR